MEPKVNKGGVISTMDVDLIKDALIHYATHLRDIDKSHPKLSGIKNLYHRLGRIS